MLWKTHQLFSLMGSSLGESGLLSRAQFDENTPMSALPPMIVTYLLAGVDGEATADQIEEGDLVDPDARPDTNASSAQYELKMEKEYGITRFKTKARRVNNILR